MRPKTPSASVSMASGSASAWHPRHFFIDSLDTVKQLLFIGGESLLFDDVSFSDMKNYGVHHLAERCRAPWKQKAEKSDS
eukprot:s1457_g5.t1